MTPHNTNSQSKAPVAQRLEQATHNGLVVGSNPAGSIFKDEEGKMKYEIMLRLSCAVLSGPCHDFEDGQGSMPAFDHSSTIYEMCADDADDIMDMMRARGWIQHQEPNA